jgi:hypothetical protein
VPKFEAKDMVYYYHDKTHGQTHLGMWRIGVVEFILDTTIADEYLYYSIEPVPQSPTHPKDPCVVVAEKDLRTLKWGTWSKANPNINQPNYQCYPNPYNHWTS